MHLHTTYSLDAYFYEGTARTPFFSDSNGAIQRLPNGNTLIVESHGGRVFEVTPDEEICWEARIVPGAIGR